LPDPSTQRDIIATHYKITLLKQAIDDFDQEISLNPTNQIDIQKKLDEMLSVINSLSEPEATAIVVTSRISGHGSSHGRVAKASCAAGHGTGSHGTCSVKSWHNVASLKMTNDD
jgi:hypothetical protein